MRMGFLRFRCLCLVACIFCTTLLSKGFALPKIVPLSADQALTYALDRKFFKKTVSVQDILIATSNRVSDLAILESAYLFDHIMRSINPKVAERICSRHVLCILVGKDELTSDIPQFATTKTGKELDFYNWRQRGFLRHIGGRPVVLFAEEDVLEYEGGMQIESILIHEFGHVIQGAGFDSTQQEKLKKAFAKARARSIWNDGRAAQRFRRVNGAVPVSLLEALKVSFPNQPESLLISCLDGGNILVNDKPTHSKIKVSAKDDVLIVFGGKKQCYAGKNHAEYWAEGVQCWYDTNRVMDHDHNHIHTREGLKSYDPGLAKLCEEILGDHDWRFISPRKRAGMGHLKDFDPSKLSKVEDLPHIQEAALDYYDKYWSSYWVRLKKKNSSRL